MIEPHPDTDKTIVEIIGQKTITKNKIDLFTSLGLTFQQVINPEGII